MTDVNIRAAMEMTADALRSKAAAFYAGVETAELRVHPDAPGAVGVLVRFEDGTKCWLVAEE
jgi:hypothetical protein